MKLKTKIIILIMVIILVSFSVWGLIKFSKKTVNEKESSLDNNNKVEKKVEDKKTSDGNVDYMKNAEKMVKPPEKGEQIAIMTVKNFGEIKLKFFPNVAPKAVENFVTHSKNGYYNGLTFHRVISEFMIQGGDPKGDGTGGESIWGQGFNKEVSDECIPIRGTLCMASVQNVANSLGSQFFITQAKFKDNVAQQAKNLSQNLIDTYTKFGGVPSLFKDYTVFGYVYEGLDIVDKIAEVTTDNMDKPTTPVVIEKIEITNVK